MSKNALLRVTQMNAIYFDNEIHNIFSEHLEECLRHLPPVFAARFNSEWDLLLKLALVHYSVVKHNATFGQKLLNVRYGNLNAPRKVLYVIATCFDYAKDKVETYRNWKDLNKFIARLFMIAQVCQFLNISAFLRSGIKPRMIDRVLGLNQEYTTDNVHRYYDTQYLTRELLWDTFIELLVYVLPLLNYHKLKRMARTLNPFYSKSGIAAATARSYTINTKCPHCKEAPILPHHMGCVHIFCYSCLKGNQVADSKYECPICEYNSCDIICERVTVIP